MMKKLLSILLASTLLSAMTVAFAAPPENAPPAQQQKNQVPDSPQNGDYLEPQPDNNNAATTGSSDAQGKQGSGHKQSKPGNLEKSKRFHEKPQDGGTGVKP